MSRDAIYTASLKKDGYAIADLDLKAPFDFLGMDWVFEVLKKKGMNPCAIERLHRYYNNGITIPIVNNIPGKKIVNKRMILRQGECPRSTWFGYSIDPLITYLNRRLTGILIHSLS